MRRSRNATGRRPTRADRGSGLRQLGCAGPRRPSGARRRIERTAARRPSSDSSTIELVVTCLVFGVPSSKRRVVLANRSATPRSPRATTAPVGSVITASAKRRPTPSKSPASMRSAYSASRDSGRVRRAASGGRAAAPRGQGRSAASNLCPGHEARWPMWRGEGAPAATQEFRRTRLEGTEPETGDDRRATAPPWRGPPQTGR